MLVAPLRLRNLRADRDALPIQPSMQVESVLQRGENLDVLVNRTDDLRDQAHKFQIQGTQLRKRMW
jgi:hypothetical protein